MQSDVRPLRDLCSLIVDCTHSTPVWTDSGYLVIRNQNIKRGRLDLSSPSFTDAEHFAHRIRRAKPGEGDIIFTREAPMGEVCMIPKGLECCVGQRQVLLRPDPDVVDGRYLLYALQSPQVQHEIGWNEGTGSTVSNVRIPVLESLKIPTPSIAVQREIGSVLGALDDRIDLLRQTNATLESIAQALFKSWFIDFEPVHAKAHGREPEGMDAGTATLFPNSFEASVLGEIPTGWELTTVSALCESIFSGGTPDTRKSEYWGGELPWFSSGETRESVVIDTEKHISQLAVDNSSTRLAKPGDVLIASAGQGLTRGQTSYCAIETYINQSVVSVRTDPSEGHAAWTFYNLSRRYEEMRALSDSHSIRGSLTTKLLAGMRVVRPPVSLMHSFGNIAGPLLAAQAHNRRKVRWPETLRGALLPRLISGKLRIPEVEDQLDEVFA